jgi:TPR repeat protein
MGKELKAIIEQYGPGALQYPDDLANAMRCVGIAEKDIHSIMLVLKCCPNTAQILTQETVGEVEAAAMLESVVRQTGLSISAARHTLGQLMEATGAKAGWELSPVLLGKCVDKSVRIESAEEARVDTLIAQLKQAEVEAETISALNELAIGGNAQAAYALGMYYREEDLKSGGDLGLDYFELAAKLGYGPANGAVADYYLRGPKKKLWKAAMFLRNPTAFAGSVGRKWMSLSAQMLAYRKENERRIRDALIIQAAILAMSLAFVSMLEMEGFAVTLAILMQLGGLGWNLLCKFFRPYHSMRTSAGLMLVSWLILLLTGI